MIDAIIVSQDGVGRSPRLRLKRIIVNLYEICPDFAQWVVMLTIGQVTGLFTDVAGDKEGKSLKQLES